MTPGMGKFKFARLRPCRLLGYTCEHDGLVPRTLSAFTLVASAAGVLCFVCYRAHCACFGKVRALFMHFSARSRTLRFAHFLRYCLRNMS